MAFDADRRKAGTQRGNVPVYHIDDMEQQLAKEKVEIAVLAVPAEVCQAVADRLVAAGVQGILNFVPKRLTLAENVKVHYVDLAIEMETLSYYLR
jgi:redox-sensing transcriptional repressor